MTYLRHLRLVLVPSLLLTFSLGCSSIEREKGGATTTGGSCSDDSDCSTGICSFYRGGVCVATVNDGNTCNEDKECKNGHCSLTRRVCQALKGYGESCQYSDDCESHYCDYSSGNTCQ